MLDPKLLRQSAADVAAALRVRGIELDVEAFESLDAERKDADIKAQDLQAQRKKASKQVGQLIGQGMSVDQPGCLIVSDQTDTFSLRGVMCSKAGHRRGLACTEKSADQMKCSHGVSPGCRYSACDSLSIGSSSSTKSCTSLNSR